MSEKISFRDAEGKIVSGRFNVESDFKAVACNNLCVW